MSIARWFPPKVGLNFPRYMLLVETIFQQSWKVKSAKEDLIMFREGIARLGVGFLPPIAAASSVTASFFIMRFAHIPLKYADGPLTVPAMVIGFVGVTIVAMALALSAFYTNFKEEGKYQISMRALCIIAFRLTLLGLAFLVVGFLISGILHLRKQRG